MIDMAPAAAETMHAISVERMSGYSDLHALAGPPSECAKIAQKSLHLTGLPFRAALPRCMTSEKAPAYSARDRHLPSQGMVWHPVHVQDDSHAARNLQGHTMQKLISASLMRLAETVC